MHTTSSGWASQVIEPVEKVVARKMAFYASAVTSPIRSGTWPVIGEHPFADEDSAWGPPQATGVWPGEKVDPLAVKIYEKGKLRRATPREVAGMEIQLFCQRPELFVEIVVDRLVKGNHRKYRV
jgi:hypothetical protein